MTATRHETYVLTIKDAAQPGDVPLVPRLRRLLKAMLRGYGIKCTDIRRHEPTETGRAGGGTEAGGG